jgi:23S rRNA (uracil1939-C5)-methyltransferase
VDRRRRTRSSGVERQTLSADRQRVIEVRIEKVVAEGDGLGRDSHGKVVFVEGALPNELVLARVFAESKDYARARVEKLLQANGERVVPPCPYVEAGCGGCDLQHASEDLQIAIKRAIVSESLRRLGGVSDADIRVSRVTDLDARRRTTVRVAAVGDRVGFRQRRSNNVVAVDTCLVAHPRVDEIMAALELRPDSEAVVRVSASTGEAIVWTEPAENLVSDPRRFGPAVGLGSRARITETIAGIDLQISAASFFQSSPGAASALVEAVQRALGPVSSWPEGTVVDAYGGVGLFSATIVPKTRRTVVLEMNPSSCADARRNLAAHDAEIVVGRVEDWTAEPAGIIIADPARDGLKSKAVHVLTSCRPEVFVLISCDPASLGRDAALLRTEGYQLEYSEVLDVFVHTHHVETVSRFVRTKNVEAQ